jgi:hypothetical protein
MATTSWRGRTNARAIPLRSATAETHRRIREYRTDSFAWVDAIQARSAELQQLADERVRLSQDTGLTPAERKARTEVLGRRVDIALQREKAAADSYGDFLKDSPLTQGLENLDPAMGQAETTETWTRAFGC